MKKMKSFPGYSEKVQKRINKLQVMSSMRSADAGERKPKRCAKRPF